MGIIVQADTLGHMSNRYSIAETAIAQAARPWP
jgi:hypothetical protein